MKIELMIEGKRTGFFVRPVGLSGGRRCRGGPRWLT
jgi:hypothetical protein